MKSFFTLLLPGSIALATPVDYVREVRPILEKHCYQCHGAEKQKSSLRLDVKSEAMKGGEAHAPNIVAGKAAESPLIQFVKGADKELLMPPRRGGGERLSAEQIATLARWIDEGAVWPEGVDSVKLADKRDHWSFKPLAKSAPGQAIDTLIAAGLREQGLAMSPEADRRTLIRRLHLVLHGLPPTPEEVEAFIADRNPRAYEKLVDRLLASPRYGERWARHWLDVIAFGETHGFEVNTPRDNAWPYRDYVIEAFNKDTRYPRFILEQLAGDSLGEERATGFIVASAALLPGQIGKDDESKWKARQDELNDMVAVAGGAFLGLTLHCARCHDHKFDPVTQADYYSLQAIFAGVRHGERPLNARDAKAREPMEAAALAKLAQATHRLAAFEPLAPSATPRAAVNAHRNVERFAPVLTQKVRFTVLATSENDRSQPCLDELEIYDTAGRNVALATSGATVRASGEYGGVKHRTVHLNDGRYGNERSWISNTKGTGWVEVQFPQAERIEAVVWGRDRLDKYLDRLAVNYRLEAARDDGAWELVATAEDRVPFATEKKAKPSPPTKLATADLAQWRAALAVVLELEGKLRSSAAGPMVYAGRFEPAGPSFRLHRGDVTQPREEVPPGAVSAIASPLKLSIDATEQQRRIAFAKWLADPANPLPARVLVNRLWQHHFGEGLVATPNDFGRNGAAPGNPALLDWLASEFIRGGWSIKHLQKLIVLSAAWKQSSAPRPDGLAADAQSRLLWRFPPRRSEAEAVRDAMLAVAGTLDPRMGGPGFSVFAPNSNYVRVYDPKPEFGPAEWRRAIYMTKVRVAQDATFGAFDCPDAGQSQPKRPRSTTAIQALSVFNSGFVTQQAELFATRVQREAGDDPAKQIARAFALTVQRPPTADESRVCAKLAAEHGLPALCRVLVNANEFLFVP